MRRHSATNITNIATRMHFVISHPIFCRFVLEGPSVATAVSAVGRRVSSMRVLNLQVASWRQSSSLALPDCQKKTSDKCRSFGILRLSVIFGILSIRLDPIQVAPPAKSVRQDNRPFRDQATVLAVLHGSYPLERLERGPQPLKVQADHEERSAPKELAVRAWIRPPEIVLSIADSKL